jgi:hypothetical protein
VIARSRLGILTVLVMLVALVPAEPVSACSCAAGSPRDRLQEAGAAFVGRLLDVEGDFQVARYTFAVDEAIKGSFAETLTIESSGNGASCGFEIDSDRPVGILLHRWRHGWSSGLCSQIEPEELRAAAKPLVVDPGAGPAVALAGGSYGEAQVVALDSDGRVVAWGPGRGVTSSLSVCPGGAVALERTIDAPQVGLKGAMFLSLRDVADLRSRRLSFLPERETKNIYRVVCASTDGSTALVAARRGLFVWNGGSLRPVAEGSVYDAVVTEPGVAYAIRDRTLIRVDLVSGGVRRVSSFADRRLSLELSLDGRFLAATRWWTAVDAAPAVLVARLDDDPLRFRSVLRSQLEGFPVLSLPDGSVPADTLDISALEQPVRIAATEQLSANLAGPSFGPVAAAPRSGRGVEAGSPVAWVWVAVAIVLAASIFALARRAFRRDPVSG